MSATVLDLHTDIGGIFVKIGQRGESDAGSGCEAFREGPKAYQQCSIKG